MKRRASQDLAIRRSASSESEISSDEVRRRWRRSEISSQSHSATGGIEISERVGGEDTRDALQVQRYGRPTGPLVYLDDNVLDRFGALPTDLPQDVVAKQIWIGQLAFFLIHGSC
jgi:hypothetical protein